MSIFLLQLSQKLHPCKESYNDTIMPPECLTSAKGKCSMYEDAIYCPKYGKPIGVMKHYGHLILEEKE